MVGSNKDIYEALKEICERHHVQRLDLHSSTTTGEDIPDGQSELNLLVEFLPRDENEILKTHSVLEEDLKDLFGRKEIGLLRVDDIKHEWLRGVLTRRRTLLYSVDGREEL